MHWLLTLACQCGDFNEAAVTAEAEHVFDGWVIEAPHPWACPTPPAPKPRKGCARIAVVRANDCKPRGELLGMRNTKTHEPVSFTSLEDDATTFCNVKPGTYVVAGESWAGDEDGTINHGRTVDIVPGGSYVVFWGATRGQKLRVGVARSIKGDVPREVTVVTKNDCGTKFYRVGEAERFFARRNEDGVLDASGCSGSRALTDDERAELVQPPAARVEPAPQPAPAPAPKNRGCSSAPVLALLLLRRRRCRRLT